MEFRPVDRVQPNYATVRPAGDTAGKAGKQQSNGEFQQALKKKATGEDASNEEQRKAVPARAMGQQSQISDLESQTNDNEEHVLNALA